MCLIIIVKFLYQQRYISLCVKIKIMSSTITSHALQSGEFAVILEIEMGKTGKGGRFQTHCSFYISVSIKSEQMADHLFVINCVHSFSDDSWRDMKISFWIYHPSKESIRVYVFIICSLIDRHLGWLHALAIVLRPNEHRFFSVTGYKGLWIILLDETAVQRAAVRFSTPRFIFIEVALVYILNSSVQDFSFPTFKPTFVVVCILGPGHSDCGEKESESSFCLYSIGC